MCVPRSTVAPQRPSPGRPPGPNAPHTPLLLQQLQPLCLHPGPMSALYSLLRHDSLIEATCTRQAYAAIFTSSAAARGPMVHQYCQAPLVWHAMSPCTTGVMPPSATLHEAGHDEDHCRGISRAYGQTHHRMPPPWLPWPSLLPPLQ